MTNAAIERGSSSESAESSETCELDLLVGGMTCASCVSHVQKALGRVPGVQKADVNLARGSARVRFDPTRATADDVAKAASDAGFPAEPQLPGMSAATAEEQRAHHHAHEAGSWGRRALVGAILWFPLEFTHWVQTAVGGHSHHAASQSWMTWATLTSSVAVMIYIGSKFYRSAAIALRHGTTNMDVLIAMGASVAFGYSLVYLSGGMLGWWTPPMAEQLYFMEAGGLLTLVSTGHWLEARARQSAGSAIRQLLDLSPATALLLPPLSRGLSLPLAGGSSESQFEQVPVAQLKIDDRVLIRPGDRVPIDGVVTDGRSSVDESMLTGESLPVSRTPGDKVIGGTINQDGRLVVRVTGVGADTALAQIVSRVEAAQSSKPPVQKLADQISAVFVPAVLGIALLTALGWWAWGASHHWPASQTLGAAAKAVCSVLIIACPCALGLAVPAAVMVGTGLGAKRGILIRDIDALQSAEKLQTIVLDKTGTITQGKPAVRHVIPAAGMTDDQLLSLAATAEQFSEHPVAQAVVRAARERNLPFSEPESFENVPGRGVVAQINGHTVLAGNAELLHEHSVQSAELSATADGQTLIHLARKSSDGATQYLGAVTLADQLKADSVAAIAQLHALGLRTVLLTGDNAAAAQVVAEQVKIDDIRADVRPGGKADVIAQLQRNSSGRRRVVGMVGDGVNDAPALAQADLGVAIGTGSDVAKETGDVVLVSGSLRGVASSIRLSRATMKKIRQNLFWAFAYNVIAIPIAAMGLLNPLVAAGAMALSDVIVIGNAILLRWSHIDDR